MPVADDLDWLRPWLDDVRAATKAGRAFQRVRRLTDPLTEYLRWQMEVTPANAEAGSKAARILADDADGAVGYRVVSCGGGLGFHVSAIVRNNVRTAGAGPTAMVFAHGFGCDQNMWRHVSPAFEDRFRTVLFDHVGAGGSDLKAYDSRKYSTLAGYADDVVEIGNEAEYAEAAFGHLGLTWLSTSAGDDAVFLLTAEQLQSQ